MSKWTLVVPEHVWREIERFIRECPMNVEQVAFLEGIKTPDCSVVLAFVVPDSILKPGNYSIPVDSVLKCAQFMRTHKLMRVAQLHTHPSTFVDHSPYDDENAYSHRDGAFSLVIPDYGRRGFNIDEIGFHVCTAGVWERVYPPDFELRLVPTMRNFRKWNLPTSRTGTQTSWLANIWNGIRRRLGL